MDLPENNSDKPNQPVKRPDLLTFLCILTFVGSGLAAFSYFIMYFSYEEMHTIMEGLDDRFPGMDIMLSLSRQFFLVSFVLYSLSLGGALLMWKLKKAGFHFYTGAQLGMLFLPLVFKSAPFSVLSVIVAAAFIAAYAVNLKYMN